MPRRLRSIDAALRDKTYRASLLGQLVVGTSAGSGTTPAPTVNSDEFLTNAPPARPARARLADALVSVYA